MNWQVGDLLRYKHPDYANTYLCIVTKTEGTYHQVYWLGNEYAVSEDNFTFVNYQHQHYKVISK